MLNIGVMVEGRAYDPKKRQYLIQPILNREEATRSVLVLDFIGNYTNNFLIPIALVNIAATGILKVVF